MRLSILAFIAFYVAHLASGFALNVLPVAETISKRDSPDIILFSRDDASDASNTYVAAQLAASGHKKDVFTSAFIAQARTQYSQFNWVICHPKHTFQFDGVQGTDWGHQHNEFDVEIGGTYGYEIYWFLSGNFTNLGSGAANEWAYDGNLKSVTGPQGNILGFEDPKNPLPPVNGSPHVVPMAKAIFHVIPVLFTMYFCAVWF